MTILCVTTTGLPGIRPCTHLGLHKVSCSDHEGWREDLRPGVCRGCLPRSADRGFLCVRCYEQVEAAYFKWSPFVRLVQETGGRPVSADGGGIKGSTPDGYTNLPLTVLALDECSRLLESRDGKTLDVWVSTEAGARDAIRFAHAAERAYRTLEVEERPVLIVREQCPNCGRVSIYGNVTRKRGAHTIVTCEWCGWELRKVRTDPPRRADSEACEQDEHAACGEVACQCACHDLGRRSTAQGITVLWDADQWAMGWVDRSGWLWDGAAVRQIDEKEKTA